MNPLDWEARYNRLRVEVQDALDTVDALVDGTADMNWVRFHRGQSQLAAWVLNRMDELAGERAPQA